MKKIIYAILIGIILAGIIIIATVGLKVNLIYSKNVEIDIFIGKNFETEEIKNMAKEAFGTNDVIVQEIELFEDMALIKIPDTFSEEDLNAKLEDLNNRINEKYEIENKVDDITISHNPKVRLSSIILPFIPILGISMVIIFIYVGIRYKKLGVAKTIFSYILWILAVEMLLLSIIAITRFPVNRIVIPIGLLLLIGVLTVLGIKNEKKLAKIPNK